MATDTKYLPHSCIWQTSLHHLRCVGRIPYLCHTSSKEQLRKDGRHLCQLVAPQSSSDGSLQSRQRRVHHGSPCTCNYLFSPTKDNSDDGDSIRASCCLDTCEDLPCDIRLASVPDAQWEWQWIEVVEAVWSWCLAEPPPNLIHNYCRGYAYIIDDCVLFVVCRFLDFT